MKMSHFVAVICVSVLVTQIMANPIDSIQMHDHFEKAANDITLTIDYGNGTQLSYYNLKGDNVLNITQSVANVIFYYDMWGYAFVTEINGVTGDSLGDKFWQYWVNGEYASSAANVFPINDGDIVVWRYTSSETNPSDYKALDASTVFGSVAVFIGTIMFLGVIYWRSKNK